MHFTTGIHAIVTKRVERKHEEDMFVKLNNGKITIVLTGLVED